MDGKIIPFPNARAPTIEPTFQLEELIRLREHIARADQQRTDRLIQEFSDEPIEVKILKGTLFFGAGIAIGWLIWARR